MMPTFLGQPFYPGGAPILPKNINTYVDDILQTIDDIKLKYWEGNASKEEEEILKEYVLYYIRAPLFFMEYENDGHEKYFK